MNIYNGDPAYIHLYQNSSYENLISIIIIQSLSSSFSKDLNRMNCHMCQIVSSSHYLASCSQCSKFYCTKCVKLHLITQRNNPKNSIKQELQSILKNKSWICFSCNKKCKCQMCSPGCSGLIGLQKCLFKNGQNKNKMRSMSDLNLQEMDKIQIFKNQDITQMPIYLQQMWMNKYALYKNTSINQKQNNIFEVQSQQEPNNQNNQPARQLQNQSYMNANDNQTQRDDINININLSANINAQFQYSNMRGAENQISNDRLDNLEISQKAKRKEKEDQSGIKRDLNEESISIQNKENEMG